MSRQAFLIIAHDNFIVLEKLIRALTCPEADIYVHIDAKVKELPAFLSEMPQLHILKKRIDTRWGDFSQIETEYALLREAFEVGGYSHYHIISGTHLPLEPINIILGTFDNWKDQTVFNKCHKDWKRQEYFKLRRINILTRYLAWGPSYFRRTCQVLRRWFLELQAYFKIERHREIEFYKASNWASFSNEAVAYLLDNYKEVRRIFKHSFCGDEFFAPTMLMMSPLKDKIVSYKMYLKMDMRRANARVFKEADYEDIVNSGCLFARKFNDADIDLIDKILKRVSEKGNEQ